MSLSAALSRAVALFKKKLPQQQSYLTVCPRDTIIVRLEAAKCDRDAKLIQLAFDERAQGRRIRELEQQQL
ncbi:hypothetical protein P8C59_006490 [Phyllachora maydis]|uniref:Uncharacterized protein n=1 Tax=Phyllachora maydis TaxID=1825666 RepID=A0AAD9I7P4_9PEZI|nr:hypothetical protein P8C59_006490 [Phyllachora maydis]